MVNQTDNTRKNTVKFSDFKPVNFGNSEIVLDGDIEKFSEWYLEMTKSLAPLNDVEDN